MYDTELIPLEESWDHVKSLAVNQTGEEVVCNKCGEPWERAWFFDPRECNSDGVVNYGLWGPDRVDPCGPSIVLMALEECPCCDDACASDWDVWDDYDEPTPPDTPSLDTAGWWFQAGF